MINIGGGRETDYLGFEDFVPDPDEDPGMPRWEVNGRRLTASLKDGSVSDICFRSTPMDTWMRNVEMPRICATGCRLTFASNHRTVEKLLSYFTTLGPILAYVPIGGENKPDNVAWWSWALHVVVVQMLLHRRE